MQPSTASTPTAVIDIRAHGARGDGTTLDTRAIQAAIEQAAAHGGTVWVPPGIWRSGTLFLRSRVTLRLDPAAILLASGDLADFPDIGSVIHHESGRSFIVADGCEDLVIEGGGVIDGNGPAFWEQPLPGSPWLRADDGKRPHPMLELRHCRRLRISDVTVRNSPGWTVHPFCCDQVVLRGVTVENHPFGPNTDGFDIDGCRDVFVSDCRLSCGDDGIIIKATPKARSTERIVITNCIVFSNCIGIGIGQETQSGVRQVAISNCVIHRSHRMVTIGIWDGGDVEDVTVSNITGDTLAHYSLARPLQFEVKQLWTLPQTRPLGRIRNVTVSGFSCRTQGRIMATAQDGAWIENLTLRDIRLDYVHLEDPQTVVSKDGRRGSNQFANENLEARRQNAAIVLEGVRGAEIDGLRVHWPAAGAADTASDGPRRQAGSPDPAWRVLWARRIAACRIAAPFARPSVAGLPAGDVAGAEDCDIRLGA
jgi:hypothetical protein